MAREPGPTARNESIYKTELDGVAVKTMQDAIAELAKSGNVRNDETYTAFVKHIGNAEYSLEVFAQIKPFTESEIKGKKMVEYIGQGMPASEAYLKAFTAE